MEEKLGTALTDNLRYFDIDSDISKRPDDFNGASFSYFRNEIPHFVEKEMERLYGSIYSSVSYFRLNGMLEDARAYVDWKDGAVMAIIVFRQANGAITVLNELIGLPAECVRRFINTLFSTAGDVQYIIFNAIETGELGLKFPCQRFNCSENIVISLPDSPDKYFDGLGKNLRKNLKYYANRIKREHPSYQFTILEGKDVDEHCIRKIAEFNVARMTGKNKASGTTEAEIKRTIDLMRLFSGFIGLTTVNGEMCAGEICCRIGSNYFILMGSHDPTFDAYRLGMLSQYMTICEFIRRGGRECHFTWGREEYKYRLQGVRRDLDRIVVYRSQVQFVLNPVLVAKTTINGRIRQMRLWLMNTRQKGKPSVKFAIQSLKTMRNWIKGSRGVSRQS